MEAKVTSARKLEVYPSKHNKEIETAETIFIEDILKLKSDGDNILLTRRNASGLSCLAYLESRPVEKLVSGDCERAITVKQLAVIYKKHPVAIADLCDEVLDKSGALLGYVRNEASNSR